MSAAPGWYPDPGGQRGRYRFWDGRAWSAITTSMPPGGPGPESAGLEPSGVAGPQVEHPRRGRAVALVVAMVAAAGLLIGLGVVVLRGAGVLGGGSAPSGDSTPTICPSASSSAGDAPPPSGDRVVSGRLSYPRLPEPFEAPVADSRTPFGRDVRSQSATVETVPGQGLWVAQVLIARLLAGDGFYGPQQGADIVARCIIGKFYWDYPVQRKDRRNEASAVDGHPAWIIEMHLSFDIPDLRTKGEVATIVVVDTGDGEAGLFYSSIPDTSPQFTAPAAAALKDLRVG